MPRKPTPSGKPVSVARLIAALEEIRDTEHEYRDVWYAFHGYARDRETDHDLIARMKRIAAEAME